VFTARYGRGRQGQMYREPTPYLSVNCTQRPVLSDELTLLVINRVSSNGMGVKLGNSRLQIGVRKTSSEVRVNKKIYETVSQWKTVRLHTTVTYVHKTTQCYSVIITTRLDEVSAFIRV
jgi:hypothetical protein